MDGGGGGGIGDELSVGVGLDEGGRVVDGWVAGDGAAEDGAVAFAAGEVEADFAGGEDVAHAEGNRHGRDVFAGAAGAENALDDDGVGAEGDDAGKGMAKLVDGDGVPAGERRLVEGDVTVVADATIADVGAAEGGKFAADAVGVEGAGDVEMVEGRTQIRVDFGDQLALEEAGKA